MHAMTEQHLRAIAFLVHAIRPDWEEPGIVAALRDVRDQPIATATRAALNAAENRRDQNTPRIIAMSGSHWPEDAKQPDRHEPTCRVCNRTRTNCLRAAGLTDDPHPFTNATPPERHLSIVD